MTARVRDLTDYRVGRAEGWGVFRALCPCGHRWVAVAPGTPTTFECPRCAAHAGRAVDAATWEAAPPEETTTMNTADTFHPDAAPYRIPAPWSLTYDVVVPVLLTVGDYLTIAGHACGRLADRLAPMPDSSDPDAPIRVDGRVR